MTSVSGSRNGHVSAQRLLLIEEKEKVCKENKAKHTQLSSVFTCCCQMPTMAMAMVMTMATVMATFQQRLKVCFKINSRQRNAAECACNADTAKPRCPLLPTGCSPVQAHPPPPLSSCNALWHLPFSCCHRCCPFTHGECALNERLIGSVFTRCQGRMARGGGGRCGFQVLPASAAEMWLALGRAT